MLDYLEYESREKLAELHSRRAEIEGSKLLDLEKRLVVENRGRFKYVCEFITKSTKNSLVLFSNVKDKYGRRIYDYLRENTDKTIFYIDGSTGIDLRDDYITRMEEGEDKILVASFGTLSTGISINNIHNIFFVESYKSEKIIRQSIGRGMRLYEGKEKVNIIDFVDDFSLKKGNKNYLLKHGEERMKIYAEQGFPYKKYTVKFNHLDI
jgi:superfamily II DNA or RNA helicase